MRTTDAILERTAKKMALDWVNENRRVSMKSPLRSLSKLWWQMNGAEWMEKARALTPPDSVV